MAMCYICHSSAPYECIRCNKDICNQHAAIAETEYEEPLIYCYDCFWGAVGVIHIRNALSGLIRVDRSRARAPDSLPSSG